MLLTWFAKTVIKLAALVLSPYSYVIIYRKKGWAGVKEHRYEIARGWDILAGKMYAPALNKHLTIECKSPFGGDETISENMARNKFLLSDNSTTADWWENKVINKFESEHLLKTLIKSKNITMTIAEIKTALNNKLSEVANELGENTTLTESQLETVSEAIDEVNETVNPNLPPRPNA